MLKPLMIAGTSSDVGKSVICTAFCRIFRQDGHNPAPFKAQNMSLNSYVTPEGLEIGRAQASQAEAAGISCHTDMNPVLLKPTTHVSSQVVLNGRPHGNQSAYQYFKENNRDELFKYIKAAFNRLNNRHSPVVIEGAGSICELNLKHRDVVNMRMALYANASTILVADIERGGIFASLYGTIKLLPEEERSLIKGIIVNKFRGDSRLFDEGRKIIEDITGVPVLGVLPHFSDILLDEEDSVSLARKHQASMLDRVNICVVRLQRISNFTDFSVFDHLPEVHLYYSDSPEEILKADIIILPGSKNTIEDLIDLKKKGIDKAIEKARNTGKKIIGICGGYQMMGEKIEDPYHVESENTSVKGLGLLPVNTTLIKEKKTIQRKFYHLNHLEALCEGYEIHMGESHTTSACALVNTFQNGGTDGSWANENCWGTYIHGIFDNKTVLKNLFKDFDIPVPVEDFNHMKDQQYDKLAKLVRQNIDMDKIYEFLR